MKNAGSTTDPPPGSLLTATLEAGPGLELSDWSLDAAALELVLAEVDAGAQAIIECGSGVSTILIGRLLRERGRGTLYSLEHDPAWLALGRSRIAAGELDTYVRLIDAPLSPDPLAQPRCQWYSRQALTKLPDADVDLLIVDGPPADTEAVERSRYPAMPVLAPRLSEGARVILDDAGRAGEAWILKRWQREFGLGIERRDGAVAIASYGRTLANPEKQRRRAGL